MNIVIFLNIYLFTGDVSPEIVPRKRPPQATPRSSNSFIGRKTKKRIMRLDSDTENSIIIEHDKNRKLACLKDTPLKIDNLKRNLKDIKNMSIQSNESIQSSDEDNADQNNDKLAYSEEDSDCTSDKNDKTDEIKQHGSDENVQNSENNDETYCDDEESSESDKEKKRISTSDDGDEDQIVMSRATRMSIMGIIPKENDSDDSDYIQSDDVSLYTFPYVKITIKTYMF